MAQVTAQAIKALVRRTGQETAPLQSGRAWKKTAVRTVVLILMAVCLCHVTPLLRTSFAQEKNTTLSDSGIVYPGGFDLNTVGDIQGKISGVFIPESGPVRMTLIAYQETYTVLASPGWFWKDLKAAIPDGTEVSVRGSKSVGKDGNLYIIAQEIKVIGSKQTLVFRSESGKALWSGSSQAGRTGAQGGGFGSSSGGSGSSSGGRTGGSSSSRGRGRR
jgi:hypothetical protein